MRVVIDGFDLPGRIFCDPEGRPLSNVHVGVQVGREPFQLVPGDSSCARWELAVRVVTGPDAEIDFKGPAVHGKRGDRFVYLTWGNLDNHAHFQMFRRAKLMLNRIDRELVTGAERQERPLLAMVRLRDGHGAPRCARVDPPDVVWRLG